MYVLKKQAALARIYAIGYEDISYRNSRFAGCHSLSRKYFKYHVGQLFLQTFNLQTCL